MKAITRSQRLALAAVTALAALTLSPGAHSEDIDIYTGGPPATAMPSILFYVDNTANWNTAFPWEKAALKTVFDALNGKAIAAGLMLFTETGGNDTNTDGAYVRSAVRPMNVATNATDLGNTVNALHVLNDKSNGGKLGVGMAEVYRYLAGKSAYAGHGKVKADRDAFASITNPSSKNWTGTYKSPLKDSCQKSIVIYISNGPSSDNNSDSAEARTQLASFGGNTAKIVPPDPTGGNEGNLGDEWSRYLNQKSDLSGSLADRQNALVYTIEVLPSTTGQGPYNTALLKSMASQGGGRYFDAHDAAELIAALTSIIAEVQAINSVFAAASLPISVNTQGTYLNQVFLGMFRPDGGAKPRWAGNLKQYQLAFDSTIGTVRLVDRNNQLAVSAITGFFLPTATSIWSTSSTFWANALAGTPPHASDAPDGEVVEKGGVAQRLRTDHATSQAGRNLLTCTNATGVCGAFKAFTNANMSGAAYQSAFGVASSGALTDLVSWVRGLDNAGDEAGPGGTTTVRPSVHGDIVHSRPAAVDYGGTTGVVVFYGSNDGMVRAVTGDKADGNGRELWGFVPPEHYRIFKRLRDNTPLVNFPNVLATVSPLPRDWGVDGSMTIYQGGGKVYLYVPMRRGGRFLYALDVTDPTTPTLLWRKSSVDIPELGQTWSEPRPATLKTYANPVLIMGAGYDAAAEDADLVGTTTMGRGVLVLDAVTGTLLKTFATTRSVPADVTLVDSNYDGKIDRAYAADLGGKIYRIDFEDNMGNSGIANWWHSAIADLGSEYKFFGAPDVVITGRPGSPGNQVGYVLVGSGDREKPLKLVTTNRFFMVKDTLSGFPNSTGTNYPTATTLGELVVGQSDASVLAGAKGWYVALDGSGEKVVNSPLTVAGTTFFSTHRPTPPLAGSCSANLGEAKAYAVSFLSGTATLDRNGDGQVNANDVSMILTGGGLPPSPVSGVVDINGTQHLFLIGGGSRGSAFEAEKPKVPIPPTRRRIYWNVVRDK